MRVEEAQRLVDYGKKLASFGESYLNCIKLSLKEIRKGEMRYGD